MSGNASSWNKTTQLTARELFRGHHAPFPSPHAGMNMHRHPVIEVPRQLGARDLTNFTRVSLHHWRSLFCVVCNFRAPGREGEDEPFPPPTGGSFFLTSRSRNKERKSPLPLCGNHRGSCLFKPYEMQQSPTQSSAMHVCDDSVL